MQDRGVRFSVKKPEYGHEIKLTEMILIFVLEGWMTVRYRDEDYKMMKEDILLINPGVNFEIIEGDDAMYGVASYTMNCISSVARNHRMVFYCNSVVDAAHSYKDLREIFLELTAEYTSCSHQTDAYNESLMLKLLDCLIENYQQSKTEITSEESEADLRMGEMMQYIIANLDSDISLNDLADQLYVSASTLSRIFKKHTGVYFADYVMQLRVSSSLSLIEHTEQSITQIALSSGFASSASYNRAFRKIYGETPTEHRNRYKESARSEENSSESNEEEIRQELLSKGYEKKQKEKIVYGQADLADYERVKINKCWSELINIGALHDLTKANMQYHLLYLSEQLHFKYFRLWSVFSKKMMLFDGKSIGFYNYDLIDQVFDFLVHHKLKPFLDFGRRPETAVSSGMNMVYFSEDYIDFSSKEAWEALVTDFIGHIVARYGEEEISGWKFELSRFGGYELRHKGGLYNDENYSYYEAYRFFKKTIQKKVPHAEFGGCGFIFNIDRKFIGDFLDKVKLDDISLDFLSFSSFPYDGDEEAEKKKERKISEDADFEEHQLVKIKRLLTEKGFGDTALYITEWNNTISNRNYLNDSCFRAAYIVRKLLNMSGEVDLMSIMCASDWISSYMDTVGIVNGGIGLITKDSIRKPAYYAIDFMNQLGDYIVKKDENFIVTRKENGDLIILCFYYSWIRRNYLNQEENIDISKAEAMISSDDKPLVLKLKLQNVGKAGNYCIKKRTLNSSYGSILNEWKKFQYNTRLTRNDIKYLESISMPNLSQSEYIVEKQGDSIDLEVRLEAHELDLIHVFWQE